MGGLAAARHRPRLSERLLGAQHPRKLRMMGSDGLDYGFLLKGEARWPRAHALRGLERARWRQATRTCGRTSG